MNSILSVKNLYFKYSDSTPLVLENISLEMNRSEILVILGQSGCGKTTLFKNLLGLLKPEKGKVIVKSMEIDYNDIDSLKKYYRSIGVLLQSGALLNSLNIYDNLKLPLDENTNLDEDLKKILISLKLKWVGLSDKEQLMPSELSGGMKKRAALARAIMLDPEILFFDEPHSGLDPLIIHEINALIMKIRELFKISTVVITHDINSALLIADKILMLNKGKTQFFGTKTEFERLSETDEYIKEFITVSNSNIKIRHM